MNLHRKGYYLAHEIGDAELHFLADAVIANKYITKAETTQIIDTIAQWGGVDFKDRVKQLALLNEMDKVEQSEFFKTIELIDQAKKQNKQVSFFYYRYGVDKKIHRGASHEVSPYQLIYHNQRYYLIGKNEKKDKIGHFRIDRIREMTLIPKDISDLHSISGYQRGIPYKDISALPFFFSDKIERIIFRAKITLIDQLIDYFGKDNVIFSDLQDDEIIGSVHTSPKAISYWAKMSVPDFEVLEPTGLRELIRADLAAALERYKR